ncbi:MAG TPA: hypothetical protein VGD24_02205 [Gallionella sp.]
MNRTNKLLLLGAIGLFSVSHAFAQPPESCGRSGEIIVVHESQSKPGIIEDIPRECWEGREDNWFAAPPEANLTTDEICQKTMKPYDVNTDRDMVGMKNMSACFCVVNQKFASGIKTKCWTYFDRDRS